MIEVTDIKGIGPAKADTLAENGYESVEDIAQADKNELADVKGVGEDRALEYMVSAGDLIDAEEEVEDETSDGDEFDLTPGEVEEEFAEDETVDEDDEDDDPVAEEDSESSEESSYAVEISFSEKFQYDVFHAALMRHHERVYTSYQPASDAMQKFIEGLRDFSEVTYEVTEFELNTLHTAVKQARSNYQGDNQIDHMDALTVVEEQIDNARREYLFD